MKAESTFARAAEKNLTQYHQDNGLNVSSLHDFTWESPHPKTLWVSEQNVQQKKTQDLVEEGHCESQNCHSHILCFYGSHLVEDRWPSGPRFLVMQEHLQEELPQGRTPACAWAQNTSWCEIMHHEPTPGASWNRNYDWTTTGPCALGQSICIITWYFSIWRQFDLELATNSHFPLRGAWWWNGEKTGFWTRFLESE